jgi:hypothetical protein
MVAIHTGWVLGTCFAACIGLGGGCGVFFLPSILVGKDKGKLQTLDLLVSGSL